MSSAHSIETAKNDKIFEKALAIVRLRFCLHVLYCHGFCAFAVTDLLSGELASTNAATPGRRCWLRDHAHWFLSGAPSSHQFAIAVWTLSLNHKLLNRIAYFIRALES